MAERGSGRVPRLVAGIERQVGWFVIAGAGVIVLLLLVVSLRTDVFAKKFSLYFFPDSAASFYIGQPVKFQGFTIGRVGEMELLPSGRVRVTLRVLERYRGMIHEQARARLVKEGLIGEQVVEVSPGDARKPVVRDGAQLEYETEASIEQLLEDIKPAVANANTLLSELAELATWLNDPYGAFRQVTGRLERVTRGLSREKLEGVVADLSDVIARLDAVTREIETQHVGTHLARSLKLANELLSDMQPLARTLGEKGPESFAKIDSLLAHVDALSRSLDIVAADLSELTPELPGLARESRGAIEEIRSLIRGMRESWLFGGGGGEERDRETIAPPVLEMQP